MGRLWMWVLGGAGLLWALKASAKSNEGKSGDLSVVIAFSPIASDSVVRVLEAILSSKTACPGLPPIKALLGTPTADAPKTIGGKNTVVVRATFSALWTHDTLGPIKEAARQCLLKHLQSVDPKVVEVSATRTS